MGFGQARVELHWVWEMVLRRNVLPSALPLSVVQLLELTTTPAWVSPMVFAEAGIRFDSECNPGVSGTNNTFSSNTVNEACATSLVDPAVTGLNSIGSNTSYNVSFDTLSGTVLTAGTCSSAGAPAVVSDAAGSGLSRRLPPTPVR